MIHRLFPYYGSKTSIIGAYPAPRYPHVVEPFAGSAAYACRWDPPRVTLNDLDRTIAELWKWLVTGDASVVPAVPPYDHLRAEAKTLVRLWNNNSTLGRGAIEGSTWAKSGIRPNNFWGGVARQLVINAQAKIRHWEITCADYRDLPNVEATWFIDPPYANAAGDSYHHRPDYRELAEWCRTRRGQVIVCENVGATWLPFEPLGIKQARRLSHSSSSERVRRAEAVWCT